MDYRRLLILLCSIGLVACNEPVVQYKRIYVSQIGQSVEFQFDVKKTGDYQFALLFSASEEKENSEERKLQINLFGDEQNEGEKIPISLRLVKDGKLFSEEVIDSSGTIGRAKFYRDDVHDSTLVREIKTMTLLPGHYSVVLSIINDNPNIDYVRSFARMIWVSPENSSRIDEQYQVMTNRWNSDWYNIWRLVKVLANELYCVGFCEDPVRIYQPIAISQTGQSVKIDFKVNKEGCYQFALMFDKNTESLEEIDRRIKLFGGFNKKGVVIPVSFKLLKDGVNFYSRGINSARSSGSSYVYIGERAIDSSERVVRILELPPGHYSVTITTLDDTPEFIGIESFVYVRYFNPKK
ncbi:DUF5625 family protein [Serratia proteamaculans]|uniref:DUF5625 family protein n=1 Tax=Serratia proteamaculans TaxID=28151 RepID=UPI001C56188D|nr:DUF5625 family protein [Serratia proteamaculans]WEO87231.1 DUF5625 family protein [Serratia proteamaculans]